MKLYIAGPMTGFENFNYPMFNAAAKQLRAAGYDVLCPTEVDEDQDCSLPPSEDEAKPWDWYMRRTIRQVTEADGIALLNWVELRDLFNSKGVMLELIIAHNLKIPVASLTDWLMRRDEL